MGCFFGTIQMDSRINGERPSYYTKLGYDDMDITRTSLAMLCGLIAIGGQAETKVTFYAPDIARIVKTKDGGEPVHRVETVTAKPQSVEVKTRTVDGATRRVVYAGKEVNIKF